MTLPRQRSLAFLARLCGIRHIGSFGAGQAGWLRAMLPLFCTEVTLTRQFLLAFLARLHAHPLREPQDTLDTRTFGATSQLRPTEISTGEWHIAASTYK